MSFYKNKEVYNILARLIRYIKQAFASREIEDYKCCDERFEKANKKRLKNKLPYMFKDDKIMLPCNDKELKKLKVVADKLIIQKKAYEAAFLAVFLEMAINRDESFFSSELLLNSNYEETNIYLIRKVNCSWEYNSKGNDCADNLFNSIICIDKNDIEPYNFRNISYNPTELKYMKELKIGFANICNTEILNIKYYSNKKENLFSVSISDDNKKLIKSIVKNILDNAIAAKVNILVFPEMFGFPELITEIQNILKSHVIGHTPIMTICPSIWENNSNRVYILDNVGKILDIQYKNHSFLIGSEPSYKEDINHNGYYDIIVIHMDKIGRIAFPVCKDLLNEKYRNIMLKTLKVNLLICPSYSYATREFCDVSGEAYCKNAIIVYNNSCAAVRHRYNEKCSNGKIIGKMTRGYLLKYDEDTHCYDEIVSEGDCLHKDCCCGCLVCRSIKI